jgi:tripartite-type tricarboxylate transporter receptor subunit TctC
MTLLRRRLLELSAAAAMPHVLPANAQTWPARPVRVLVGFAPGQAIDILARLISQWLSDRLGQQFVVENKPGGGGNIVVGEVVRAAPDGHTLLAIGANNAINGTLYERLPFNLLRDIAPVAGIYRIHQVMVVNPSFPARTVAEFIAFAKANPGKVNFASSGTGSVAHASGELFRMMAGLELVHVPYRGAPPALADLLAGQVQVMFDNLPSSIEHVKSGRLRALGVSAPAPLDVLRDVPTIGATVTGYETVAFVGLGAPAGTPADIVDKLNKEVNAGLADPKVANRIRELGGTPLVLSADDFAAFLAAETEKWGKVVRFAGMKAD